MDTSLVIPLLASTVAVTASLIKDTLARKKAQSMYVITRADGSTIKVETEKANLEEVKRIVDQIMKAEPEARVILTKNG